MKNLKKVLALVVVFSMMLGTVAFAAFPDVAEDADYANAVNTLAALNIVGGDDQGNFNPDNTITRAEFTKMVCEMQGIKGDASKGATIFTDVAADHWASGYINMATGMGIINGMGDGTFAPSAPVTYEQAIKMIVVALGYEPMAADRGGYPTGYLTAAQASGLTKGIKAPAQTDAAVRSLIAELVCNALDVPMMQQTGFGTDKKFEVMDGASDGEDRITLLSSKFDVVKVAGVVSATEFDALDSCLGDDGISKAAEGEVKITFDDNFKSTNPDFELEDRDDVITIAAEIGDTNAADFFGKRVIAFIAEDGKDYVVIAIVEEDGKNETLKIAGKDIDNIDDVENIIYYWEDEDARAAEEAEITAGASIIWNNKVVDAELADLDNDALSITLVDWDAKDGFDLIVVEQYAHFVVEEIDADIYTLTSMEGENEIVLDPENEDLAYTIVDKNGNAIDFDDIKTGDVLAVITDDIGGFDADEFINIIDLGANTIEGTVRATGDGKFTIGDEAYERDVHVAGDTIRLGSEGIFYLGIAGQIVAFDGTTSAGNYAIILGTEAATRYSKAQISVLNKDGDVVIYNVAKDLKLVNGDENDKFANDEEIPADYFAGDWAAYNGLKVADILDAFNDMDVDDDASIAMNFVQIKVNGSDEIYEIAAAGEADTFSKDEIEEDVRYRATSMRFVDYGKIDDSTVIFAINKNDIEKSKILTASALIDDAEYTLAGFGEEENIFGAAIIFNGGDSLAGSVNGMAVVTNKAYTVDANDVDAIELTVVVDGSEEAKTILVTEDTLTDREYNADADAYELADDMTVGSLLLYTADDAGVATVIASIANFNGTSYDFVIDENASYGPDSNKTKFVYGITNENLSNDLNTTDGRIDIKADTNKYRLNNSGLKDKVVVGSFKGGNVKTPTDDEGNYIVARIVDDEVVDIISIDARVAR